MELVCMKNWNKC